MIEFLKLGYQNILNNIYNINIIIFFSSLFIFLILNTFTNIFKRNTFIYILFNMPGTFFHELAHFFVGLITFGKPENFSLIPSISKESITFGSVRFSGLNFFNTLPIALAPYLLLPFSLILIVSFSNMLCVSNSLDYYSLLYAFIVYSTLISCFPSSVDWRVAFSNKFGLIFYVIIFYFFLFNFDIIKTIFKEVLK